MRPLTEIEKEIGYKVPPCEYNFSPESEIDKISPALAEYAIDIRVKTLYKAMMVAKDILEDPKKPIYVIEACLNIISAAETLCSPLAQSAATYKELSIQSTLKSLPRHYRESCSHLGTRTGTKSSSEDSDDSKGK